MARRILGRPLLLSCASRSPEDLKKDVCPPTDRIKSANPWRADVGVGLCQQFWQKRRILPETVAQIVTNRGIEHCKPIGISARLAAFDDILHHTRTTTGSLSVRASWPLQTHAAGSSISPATSGTPSKSRSSRVRRQRGRLRSSRCIGRAPGEVSATPQPSPPARIRYNPMTFQAGSWVGDLYGLTSSGESATRRAERARTASGKPDSPPLWLWAGEQVSSGRKPKRGSQQWQQATSEYF